MIESSRWIWLDGSLVAWEDAKVHVLSHTLHYGLGIFEGLRAYEGPQGPCIYQLQAHTRRFFDSAKIMGLSLPYSAEELMEAQKQVVAANELRECYIRPICFFGPESLALSLAGLSTHLAIAAWSWPSYLSPEAQEQGIKLRTSSFTRHHVNTTMCKAKTSGHYVNSLIALKEAQDSGCDEAMLLDNEGYVTEGSGENLFVVRDNKLRTPDLTSCLPGITRDTIFKLAEHLGLEVEEARITRDETYIADEVFLSGTAVEVMPVREIDDRVIGSGRRGPITEQLQSLYLKLVRGGLDIGGQDWLTPVT